MTRLDSCLKILGLFSAISLHRLRLAALILLVEVVCLRLSAAFSSTRVETEGASAKKGEKNTPRKKGRTKWPSHAQWARGWLALASRAARSPDGLVGGDAVEERERVAGGGDAAAGQAGAALEVL